jgi:hypothetical protein
VSSSIELLIPERNNANKDANYSFQAVLIPFLVYDNLLEPPTFLIAASKTRKFKNKKRTHIQAEQKTTCINKCDAPYSGV